jgi:hypothetical protein
MATKKTKRKPKAEQAIHPTVPVAIADLKPHPENYKDHPEHQLAHIVRSIEQNGFYRNIVIAKDNTILAGHGVVAAAQKIGLKDVPVIRLNLDPMDPRALKVLAGDNQIGLLADVDDRQLTALIQKIVAEQDQDLLGSGFDDLELARRMAADQAVNPAIEWDGMPEFNQEDKTAQRQIIVSFASNEDVRRFAELLGQSITDKTRSLWYPQAAQDKVADLRYAADEPA